MAKGLGKRHPVDVHHEAEYVPAFSATKALENLQLGIDVETGGFFLVEGTQPHPVAACFLELGVGLDDLDNIGPVADFLDLFIRDVGQLSTSNQKTKTGSLILINLLKLKKNKTANRNRKKKNQLKKVRKKKFRSI